jgi:hypothetical protein
MKNIFGLNYFVFCILVLALVLFFTKEMRDEGFFDNTGALVQLASTEAFYDDTGALIQLESTEAFYDDTGALIQLDSSEAFGMSPGTLTQLQSTSVPSGSRCSQLPPMNTSMTNPMSTPLGDLIQNNLTEQGILRMTEVPKKDPGFYALI